MTALIVQRVTVVKGEKINEHYCTEVTFQWRIQISESVITSECTSDN